MKLYKVFFENDQNSWIHVTNGFLCLSTQKKMNKYKILEFPDDLILKYSGVGNYEFEKDFTSNLSFEVAIPFTELENLKIVPY